MTDMKQETKDRISKALKGRPKTQRHKEAISIKMTGRKLTETHKEALRYVRTKPVEPVGEQQ